MPKKTICVIIKDEHQYIEEWVEHCLNIGFDKIYIYEDTGSESHSDILSKYGDKIELELFDNLHLDWKKYCGSQRQEATFDYFIKNHNGSDEWCAFIDPDEYIFFEEGWTLDKLIDEFKDEQGVYLYWKLYGANGHIRKPEGRIVDNYTTECEMWAQKGWPVKSFINFNKYTGGVFHIHMAPGLVNTCGVSDSLGMSFKKCWINHYFTKSFEDWCFQILKRGDINRGCITTIKSMESFFKYNTDMVNVMDECNDFLKKYKERLGV